MTLPGSPPPPPPASGPRPGSASGARALDGSARLARPGRQLGPFLVLGALGRGAMGSVLAVRDAAGRELALKLLGKADPSPQASERFRREAEVTAALRHPGIVGVHGTGVVEGVPYIAYELVRGRTLGELLPELDRATALRLVQEVAEALGHAHAQGVLHRDVKPENVLVDEAGRAHVADFGLAQVAGLERLTLSGALVGTPQYMAPEQVAGRREAFGPHTDTWAVGVLLYRVLTGREPFQGSSFPELAARVLGPPPTPPRRLDPTISPALEAVCLKALEQEPARRYSHGAALAADLAQARAALAPDALRERRLRRAGLLMGGLGLGGLALLGGLHLAREPAAATPAGGEPVGARESAEAQRLRDGLEEALAPLARGELPPATQRLGRLASELAATPRWHERLRDVQREQAEALTAALAAGDGLVALQPRLELLAALAAALPAREPPFPGASATADALVRRLATAWVEGRRREVLDAMRALVACRARVADRTGGADLVEALLQSVIFQPPPTEEVTALLLLGARLDLPQSQGSSGAGELIRYAPQGDEPWERYARLRMQSGLRAEGQKAIDALATLLEAPPPGFELGPIHWAETAARVAALHRVRRDLPGAIALLQRATERDPESVPALRELALALEAAGRQEEALAPAQAALRRLEALGFDRRDSTRTNTDEVVTLTVRLLSTTGRREAAKALFRSLPSDSPDRKGLAAALPWLEEE